MAADMISAVGLALVLTRDVGSRAVHSLEHGVILADIRTRGDAQTADQACGQVAGDVTVQVGEHHYVELRRSMTMFMQKASMMRSSNSTRPSYSLATSRAVRRNRPSEYFMILAL